MYKHTLIVKYPNYLYKRQHLWMIQADRPLYNVYTFPSCRIIATNLNAIINIQLDCCTYSPSLYSTFATIYVTQDT